MKTRSWVTTERARAFGAHLKQLRLARGLTGRQVEHLTNAAISNSYLSQIEQGKIKNPSPSALAIMARAYRQPFLPILHLVYPDTQGHAQTKGKGLSIHALSREESSMLLSILISYRARMGATPEADGQA